MPQESLTVTTPDQHRIAVHVWPCPDKARGTVHWLHGMAEHGARYEHLAATLNRAGWHLVTHDHRGHGASVISERDRGHFADRDGWEKVLEDVGRVRDLISERFPGLPQVLGGHSMGSFIALDAAGRHRDVWQALILCGSDYHRPWFYRLMRLPMLVEKRRHGPRGHSALIRSLTFGAWNRQIPGAQTDFDWLSALPEQVSLYLEDPCCGHDCSVRLWLDLMEALPRIHARRTLAALPGGLPVLVIGGGRDPMSRNGRGTRALARALRRAGKPVTCTLYPRGRHEILNDTCREDVEAAITAFLPNP